MTLIRIPTQKNKKEKKTANTEVAFCLMVLFSLFLLLCSPDVAIASMRDGLLLCANTVIPSLFPFMVISELLVKSGTSSYLGKIASPLFSPVFGLGKES